MRKIEKEYAHGHVFANRDENYCMTHKTQKATFLRKMLKYTDNMEMPDDAEMMRLAKYIEQERDEELREALKNLDDYLCM